MRTIVYIESFNLYLGCLKETPFKWLDVYKLCETIIKIEDPGSQLLQVKFFTSPVKANLSRHGADSVHAQQSYHRALKSLYPAPTIGIIQGYYSLEVAQLHPNEKPIPLQKKVEVWRPEEKQTDVKIALSMYKDVRDDVCDQVVLFSNDSDLVPVYEHLKESDPDIRIGTVLPVKDRDRKQNAELRKHSNWNRARIKEEELLSCQLPNLVPTSKKPAIKPDRW